MYLAVYPPAAIKQEVGSQNPVLQISLIKHHTRLRYFEILSSPTLFYCTHAIESTPYLYTSHVSCTALWCLWTFQPINLLISSKRKESSPNGRDVHMQACMYQYTFEHEDRLHTLRRDEKINIDWRCVRSRHRFHCKNLWSPHTPVVGSWRFSISLVCIRSLLQLRDQFLFPLVEELPWRAWGLFDFVFGSLITQNSIMHFLITPSFQRPQSTEVCFSLTSSLYSSLYSSLLSSSSW